MMGKHSEEGQKIKELEELVTRKEKEIKDIKISVTNIMIQVWRKEKYQNCALTQDMNYLLMKLMGFTRKTRKTQK